MYPSDAYYRQPRHNQNQFAKQVSVNKISQSPPPKYIPQTMLLKQSYGPPFQPHHLIQNYNYLSQSPIKRVIENPYVRDLSVTKSKQTNFNYLFGMKIAPQISFTQDKSNTHYSYFSQRKQADENINQQQIMAAQINNQRQINYAVNYKIEDLRNNIPQATIIKTPQISYHMEQQASIQTEQQSIKQNTSDHMNNHQKYKEIRKVSKSPYSNNNQGKIRTQKQIYSSSQSFIPAFSQDKIAFQNNITQAQNNQSVILYQDRKIPEVIFQNPKKFLKIDRILGSGKFSNVHLCRDTRTNILYALKIIDKKTITKYRIQDQITNEIKIQTLMNHPNIIKMFSHFADEQFLYLVIEYASDGDLYKFLKGSNNSRLTESQTANVIKQIASAIQELHNQSVIHRDIKPENIMRQQKTYKLSDLGCAVYCPKGTRKTFCGTLDYVSPELAIGTSYGSEVDLWALGILAYELVTGDPPFFDESNVFDKEKTLTSIIEGRVSFGEGTSYEFRDFVMRLLQRDPFKRMSISSLFNHQWMLERTEAQEANLTL